MTDKLWDLLEMEGKAELAPSVDGHGQVRKVEQPTLGRMGGFEAGGPGGECVCPECKRKIPHETGEPCSGLVCSECGTAMVRAEEA